MSNTPEKIDIIMNRIKVLNKDSDSYEKDLEAIHAMLEEFALDYEDIITEEANTRREIKSELDIMTKKFDDLLSQYHDVKEKHNACVKALHSISDSWGID